MRPFSAPEVQPADGYLYDLSALVCHHGNSVDTGHYTAFCKDAERSGLPRVHAPDVALAGFTPMLLVTSPTIGCFGRLCWFPFGPQMCGSYSTTRRSRCAATHGPCCQPRRTCCCTPARHCPAASFCNMRVPRDAHHCVFLYGHTTAVIGPHA